MAQLHLNNLHASDRTFKTITYSSKDFKPISDSLCIFKGRLYGTKEDLKYYPKKVRLVRFKSAIPIKIRVKQKKDNPVIGEGFIKGWK